MATAKFMMFNLYADINNDTAGLSNVIGETFAENYFSGTDYLEAVKIYKSSIFKFIRECTLIYKWFNLWYYKTFLYCWNR